MASPTTKLDVAKFEAKCSGLISQDRAVALLEAMVALEQDFDQLKWRNAQNPGSKLKATYDECVSGAAAQPASKELDLAN
jgi:hypothetical protein